VNSIPTLQALMDEAVHRDIPGISIAIANRDRLIASLSAGVSNVLTSDPIRSSMLFGIGSITKTFIAVVILQLIEENELRVQDTAAGLLGPLATKIPNADRATIAQLLSHTSGIPSWEDDPNWIKDGRGVSSRLARIWGKTETLEYVRGGTALFSPGNGYHYSNTNYTLLGLIIERVTGREAHAEIRERILTPLHLTNTYLEGFDPLALSRVPNRYHWATPEFRHEAGLHAAFREVCPHLIDVSGSNLSVEWVAGGMLSTAQDLACFASALCAGKMLSAKSMQYMLQWSSFPEGTRVGHGLFLEELGGGHALIGHNGGVLGFCATFYWIAHTEIIVAAMCNVGTMHSGKESGSLTSVVKGRAFVEAVLCFAGERDAVSG
jgi:D-alanyl-D-alanine carboxypeptidase